MKHHKMHSVKRTCFSHSVLLTSFVVAGFVVLFFFTSTLNNLNPILNQAGYKVVAGQELSCAESEYINIQFVVMFPRMVCVVF